MDFLVAMVMPSISNPIIELWDNVVFELAEKAKDKGIKGIDEFLESPGGKEKRYDFAKTNISQDTLNKFLKGEFKTLKELSDTQNNLRIKMNNYEYESSLIYTLFHYIKKDEDVKKDLIIIDTIFINEKN
ncbi:P-loop NTPase family protein [Flavobacterium sharifuzzamanii]|uniref:hypothetical protein n=1 Tax=Flavobacterium sharifuzzamanii TaxID=2211133 RepID=UPI0013002BFA|nr:hypothetical protein [Flavobacterium sharifuzzamanii]KAF2079026.1 hypothetical protein DMA14_21305 [Flavobacterium sharifuzzamanii]